LESVTGTHPIDKKTRKKLLIFNSHV